MDKDKKRILITEDDASHRYLLSEIIANAGYEPIVAENGKVCIEKVKSQKPDLILMDIRMPVMDGEEAIKILKSDPGARDIPIVCLTASVAQGSGAKDRLLSEGCDSYLEKPSEASIILGEIDKYLK